MRKRPIGLLLACIATTLTLFLGLLATHGQDVDVRAFIEGKPFVKTVHAHEVHTIQMDHEPINQPDPFTLKYAASNYPGGDALNSKRLGGYDPSHYQRRLDSTCADNEYLAGYDKGREVCEKLPELIGQQIQDNSITNEKLAPRSITGDKINHGAIQSENIDYNTIGEAHLKANSISQKKIQDNSVGTTKLQDNSITTNKLAADPNSIAKLSNHAININSGNIGIGTTNPTATLDIKGSMKANTVCIGEDCRAAWPDVSPQATIACNWQGWKCSCNADSSGGTEGYVVAGLACENGQITDFEIKQISLTSRNAYCPAQVMGCDLYGTP